MSCSYSSIWYERLKIIFKKFFEDCDFTLDELKALCRDYVPEDKRNGITSVEELVDNLEKEGSLRKDDVSIVKVLAEALELENLKKEVEKYEWNHVLGFPGKAFKVVAQAPESCWGALKGGAKEVVIILKTYLKTTAQAAAICTAIGVSVLTLYSASPEILQTSFRDILPYAMNLVGLRRGSLYFVLETSSLSSLKELWTSYKDGSLEKKFKKAINGIDEVRKLTQGTEIDVTVEIDEDEYREACWVLLLAKTDQAEAEKESIKSVRRLHQRRHSLSCERDLLPSRDKTQLSWQEWRTLKEVENKLENETRRRIYVEKQNEELRKEVEVIEGTKETAKTKKEDIMALKEKNQELMAEEPREEEIEVLKGTNDNAKSEKEDITALDEETQTLISASDQKKIEKLKKGIEYREEILKSALETNDKNRVGTTYFETGLLYSSLGTLYKKTNEKENWEDTMKKAESYFREAADSLEKLNARLNNEEELKSVVDPDSLFRTYEFLTTVLLATKQIEEALVVSDCTRDRGLVDSMIKKFQMNKNEILGEFMKYANISSILGNESFSVLIFSVRDKKVNIWTLEYQKPCFFLEKMVPFESEQKRASVDNYITNLVDAARLYELLIAPVLPSLAQDKLVIIADGPLSQLIPFAALRDPETGQLFSEIKCIRYAPSLTAMKVWKECPVDYHGNKGALVVGDPDVGKVMFEGEEKEFARLPFVQREAMVVSAILNARPLIGPQATKVEVLKRLQDHLAVIHIAAMGNEKGEILLTPSAATREVKVPEEEDYLLTMKEVQEMHVRAQLVVLSVSVSGRGEITRGKVNSMARAFLAAGARAVVATLWGIDEVASKSFMVTLYTYLKMGESASKSLQNAMKELREEGFDEPRYWAPFFLIGDDVTISP